MLNKLESSSMQSRDLHPKLPDHVIGNIFQKLQLIVGVSRFETAYGSMNAQLLATEWASSLAGFRPVEIGRGLEAVANNRGFAPSLAEFRVMCRPCLDPECAYFEAVEGMRIRDQGQDGFFSHPAVFRAGCRLRYELRSMDFRSLRNRWKHVLEQELSMGWGQDVPPVPPRVESKPVLRGPSEVDRARINAILEAYRGKSRG